MNSDRSFRVMEFVSANVAIGAMTMYGPKLKAALTQMSLKEPSPKKIIAIA